MFLLARGANPAALVDLHPAWRRPNVERAAREMKEAKQLQQLLQAPQPKPQVQAQPKPQAQPQSQPKPEAQAQAKSQAQAKLAAPAPLLAAAPDLGSAAGSAEGSAEGSAGGGLAGAIRDVAAAAALVGLRTLLAGRVGRVVGHTVEDGGEILHIVRFPATADAAPSSESLTYAAVLTAHAAWRCSSAEAAASPPLLPK